MKGSRFKGYFCSKMGFTLIELLVVVLIIGILASVAVPQYKKAVFKSRFTQVQMGLNAYMKGIDAYILANGFPTENSSITDKLDVEMLGDLRNNSGAAVFSFGHFGVGCVANEFCGVGFLDQKSIDGSNWESLGWLDGKVYLSKQADSGVWFLNDRTYSNKTDNLQAICQWWASTRGVEYMQDDIKARCAAVGVQ